MRIYTTRHASLTVNYDRPINPKYYEKMSVILDELIKVRREGAITYEKMLDKYVELIRNVENPENNLRYPKNIRHSGALRALFDNCGEDEELVLALDRAVRESKHADFRHNDFKERRIKKAILRVLFPNEQRPIQDPEVERVYIIVVKQREY